MKEIKELTKLMKKELHFADKLAKMAAQYKGTDRELADTYAKLAEYKVDDAVNKLHGQAVRKINEWKAKTGQEAPKEMQALWDFQHDELMDEAAKVKSMISVYKGL